MMPKNSKHLLVFLKFINSFIIITKGRVRNLIFAHLPIIRLYFFGFLFNRRARKLIPSESTKKCNIFHFHSLALDSKTEIKKIGRIGRKCANIRFLTCPLKEGMAK